MKERAYDDQSELEINRSSIHDSVMSRGFSTVKLNQVRREPQFYFSILDQGRVFLDGVLVPKN